MAGGEANWHAIGLDAEFDGAEHIENEMEDAEDEYNEEEDEEDGGGEEDDDANESYGLRFYGEMDPLDFAHKDSSNGGEIYQQFQRLEYEALAERKRKALLDPKNRDEQEKKLRDEEGAAMEVINEFMNFRRRRRSKGPKKRGRKKGTKNNLSPEVARKIGDATLHYASENYDEAICLLEEIVRLAPCAPDGFYMLGLIYDAKGDRKKALNFHMIAAHLTPKDSSLWNKLVAWSIEENNAGQLRYCLSKAITADPKDASLRFHLASLYFELGEYQKAARLYSQIVGLYPGNILARKMAAKMFQKCGLLDKAISVLEDFVNDHCPQADQTIIDLLITLLMENKEHTKALHHIKRACLPNGAGNKFQLYLKAKAVICHAHLGNLEHAESLLKDMEMEQANDNHALITEVANTFTNLGNHDYAMKFYFLLEGNSVHSKGSLHLKIAECYMSMKEKGKAIPFFYKALLAEEDNIDARITLSSLLIEENKENEAIILLSSPKSSEHIFDQDCAPSNAWWLNAKIKLQLAKIYCAKGMHEDFVQAIFSIIRRTLEIMNQKLKKQARHGGNPRSKKLPRSTLSERAKILEDQQADNVFHKMKSCSNKSEMVKAYRAKKALEKMAALTEEKKAAAIADGADWQSEDSEDEAPVNEYSVEKAIEEPPLPGLLHDDENRQLILDLCKALVSLHRYSESLEIINLTLKLADSTLSIEKKEEIRSLGAQIAYNTKDPKHGYTYAKCFVQRHPYSIAAWNCYYKVVSRLESRLTRHGKFMNYMRRKQGDCVPPVIISGHEFTNIRQHQNAAANYLEAYKVHPENPLINLCVGTALINLALGHRIQNSHWCIVQGFAFLYDYMGICNNSQEAMYNVARACHHVGLVTLAASYYEKVLTTQEKDYPMPKLPNENPKSPENQQPGYCSLHREAAYNLHLIYKKSGAVDLARQVLKNYCTP